MLNYNDLVKFGEFIMNAPQTMKCFCMCNLVISQVGKMTVSCEHKIAVILLHNIKRLPADGRLQGKREMEENAIELVPQYSHKTG